MQRFRPTRFLHYRLDGRRAVPCEDLIEWSLWFETADRRVAETWIDEIRISTVFLGLNYNPLADGDPVLFETMVFVSGEDHSLRRYFIWEEAEAGHAETVAEIQAEMDRAGVKASLAWQALLQQE